MIYTAHQRTRSQLIFLSLFFFLAAHALVALPRPQDLQGPALSDSIAELCAKADSGDSLAMQRLNRYLLRYDSSSPDYAIAVDWLRPRASRDIPDAQFVLGYLLEHGHGVPKDLAQAAVNYELAAAHGVAAAQNNLAALYQGGLGVPRDPQKAFELYSSAARLGYSVSQTNLASMYYTGAAVPRDYALAAKWFRAAAEQGDSIAQHNLGVLYYQGLGVPRDYAAAAHWEGLAAVHGNPLAQTDLAYFYETAAGVPQDYFAAYLWYSRAIANGELSGTSRRDAIARFLNRKQRDEGQAVAAAAPSGNSPTTNPSGSLALLPTH